LIESTKYNDLIAKESQHWDEVQQDPRNPQIWHDARMFDIFFGKEYRNLVESAVGFGPSILELGCGEGNLSLELASRGLRVTAIDLSPQRIERAETRAKERHFNTPPRFIVGDLNTISLPVAAFDCVVAHDSLHHIALLSRLCDEAKKSLRPGGHFLVMDYIGMGLIRKLLAGFLYAILPTYQSYKTKWGFRKRLSAFLASEEKNGMRWKDRLRLHCTMNLRSKRYPRHPFSKKLAQDFTSLNSELFAPSGFTWSPRYGCPTG
jgi:2-polyprenyl-3-methyl-5-hydroxy-6-metoxy-1,4-benzoquinol methylase